VEPYTPHLIELDANSFDNISWKLRYNTFSVVVDPNIFKRIEIPVAVVGEVSGTVYREKDSDQQGIGRISVNIFDEKGKLVGKTLSEPDGYYSYLGLAPGSYEARIDAAQLTKLHLLALPEKQKITIQQGLNGDTVEGIDFVLKSKVD
jgi:hypothetical protein